jgi:hypothetical protein
MERNRPRWLGDMVIGLRMGSLPAALSAIGSLELVTRLSLRLRAKAKVPGRPGAVLGG